MADTTHQESPVESREPETMTIGKYAATRFSTLKPPMLQVDNPIRLLGMLTGKQWLFFLVGFLAWVCSICSTHSFQRLDKH
jgi:SHS family lactate transporter-like MFS transporter